MKNQLVKKNILGVEVTDATKGEVLEYVFNFIKTSREKMYIVTPNPEIVMYALSHKSFLTTLNNASISLCDGIGLFKAGEVMGEKVKERISGVDLMENLCEGSVKKIVSVGFLGGRNGVAEKTAKCLSDKYPGLRVAFVGEEWPGKGLDKANKYKGESIRYKAKKDVSPDTLYQPPYTNEIDLLFVAFGFPKQEEWIAANLDKLPVRVMMGVGGSFDYLSGAKPRAPRVVREIGLEWLYRLLHEPWRIQRQLALPKFALLVFRKRFLR